MTWITVRTRYSLRQVWNSNSTVQTSVCHGQDARSTNMEIACRRSTVQTAINHGPDVRSLSKEITCSRRAIVRTTVPHHPDPALKHERFSVKISEFWSHSCPSGRPMSTIRTAPVFIVSILASFCVWTKSLTCKDVVNMDSTCQSIFRRLCTVKKIEDFSFPVSRPDDVSSRPDAHLSTFPSVWTKCSSRPDARQTSIIRPDDVSFSSRLYTVSRSLCSILHPSGHLSSPSGRLSVLEQSQIRSKFQ
jgi:hypothetical protein